MRLNTADFDMTPHTITRVTRKGGKIGTNALKVQSSYNQRTVIFNGLLYSFKKAGNDENLTILSNKAKWKLIQFSNNTLSINQMTELIIK